MCTVRGHLGQGEPRGKQGDAVRTGHLPQRDRVISSSPGGGTACRAGGHANRANGTVASKILARREHLEPTCSVHGGNLDSLRVAGGLRARRGERI